MNTDSVPICKAWAMLRVPPCTSTKQTARELKNTIMGIYRALSIVARTEFCRISSVISENSRRFWSSITSVLLVLAPVIPSLYARVISELMRRTRRLTARIRFWKTTVIMAIRGTMAIMGSASFQLIKSMVTILPSTKEAAQKISTRLHANMEPILLVSLMVRATMVPTGVTL